jgi:hypothetical protein
MTMRCAFDIIEAIARQLEPHLVPQLQTHYASVCRETEVGTLQQFLNTGPLSDTCKTMRLLKCIHQEVPLVSSSA